jgi:hypothetical protein
MIAIVIMVLFTLLAIFLFVDGWSNHCEYRRWERKHDSLRKARHEVRNGRKRYPLDVGQVRRSLKGEHHGN